MDSIIYIQQTSTKMVSILVISPQIIKVNMETVSEELVNHNQHNSIKDLIVDVLKELTQEIISLLKILMQLMLQRISLAQEMGLIHITLQTGILMVSTLVTSPKTTKEDTVIVKEEIFTQDYHNSIKGLVVDVLKELTQGITIVLKILMQLMLLKTSQPEEMGLNHYTQQTGMQMVSTLVITQKTTKDIMVTVLQ